MRKFAIPFIVAFFLMSCDALTGEEVGRLQINELSTEGNLLVKETTFDLKKGDEVAIWSEMDLEYEGDVGLRFRVQVWKDSVQVNQFEIDPMKKNITLGEIRTTVMEKTDWSFSGKNSEFEIEDDGQYTFKGILISSGNPTLKVKKAEVVFKK